jgi:hypothetical protein
VNSSGDGHFAFRLPGDSTSPSSTPAGRYGRQGEPIGAAPWRKGKNPERGTSKHSPPAGGKGECRARRVDARREGVTLKGPTRETGSGYEAEIAIHGGLR